MNQAKPVCHSEDEEDDNENEEEKAPVYQYEEEDLASSAAPINPSHGGRSVRAGHPSFPLLLRRALATSAAGCKCGPSTPIPNWKIYDVPPLFGRKSKRRRNPDAEFRQHSGFVGAHRFRNTVSARKLAAALWELEGMSSYRSRRKEQASSDAAPVSSRFSSSYNRKQYTKASYKKTDGRHKSVSGRRKGHHDVKTCRCPYLECRSGISKDLLRLLHQLCSLEEQHRLGASVIASLRRDLKESQDRAQELKAAQKVYREDIARLKKKLAEEKSMSHLRVQEAVMMAVKPLKEELEKEKKSRHKLEAYQKKIIKEMNEAKKALLKVKKDLEREKRARELIEDVCDELAKEISDDKAKVEELRRQSAKVREEVEEERKMLQMADVWREERVHMKLAEAKHELEKKNTALDRLRSEFGAILQGKNDIHYVKGGSSACNDQMTTLPLQISELETAGQNAVVQTVDNFDEAGNKGSTKGSFDEIEVSNLSYVGSLDVNRSFYPTPAFSDAGKKPVDSCMLSCNETTMGNQKIWKREDMAGPSADWKVTDGADISPYGSVSLQKNNGAISKDAIGYSRKQAVLGKGHHRSCKSGHDEIQGPFLMESVLEGRSSHDSSKSKYQSTTEAFSVINLHGHISPSKAGPSVVASPRKDGGASFPSPLQSTCLHCHQENFHSTACHMNASAGNDGPNESQRGCIKDNSLRAMLLEAKLEAQQGRVKDNGYKD